MRGEEGTAATAPSGAAAPGCERRDSRARSLPPAQAPLLRRGKSPWRGGKQRDEREKEGDEVLQREPASGLCFRGRGRAAGSEAAPKDECGSRGCWSRDQRGSRKPSVLPERQAELWC